MTDSNTHWNFKTNEDGQLVITVTMDPLPSGSIWVPPVTMSRKHSLLTACGIINNRMVAGGIDVNQRLGEFVRNVLAKDGDL